MIGLKSSGDFDNTRAWAKRMLKRKQYENFHRYGKMGVDALSSATPIDTALAANSWGYELTEDGNGISWYNTNVEDGRMVVILIQYGHGTGTGGFVAGRDFINPAIQPVFDQIVADVWRQVRA
jgi:hypothetical protein